MPIRRHPSIIAFFAASLSIIFASLPTLGMADQPTGKSAQRQPRKNDPFAAPKVDPNLPNVLLIGDSISIGYMLDARKAMEGKANVFRPATNCGPTTRGLEQLNSWLGDRQWDVIHFNFGLHDLKFMGPNGQNLADPESPTSKRQVPLPEYKENLRKIASRLKETGATLIWRETTPVPEGAKGRLPEDGPRYNQAAAEVMASLGDIQTDPFYDFALQHAKTQRKANVHYTAEGSKLLGEHVAAVVTQALR
ncbi:SGNH/GDSL hydrolase family protein [Rhodopirellula sp. JC740]|uniref:SGNH/GDSL hydrolase family protein n=1 Tax=Rhodopirellula halodulae TaxID=2894198 RepID=A0ABS8ND63_9BACT|nr:SGNH/GDSL hydrolase family protein [Rhodopirellula sp. JC740]MCC9641495.1 SGNH/GDSL hydrolase family protein [Rhodopirellula sp. JC740]